MSDTFTHLKESSEASMREYAEALDNEDPLKRLRSEFIVPTKADLKRRTLAKTSKYLSYPRKNLYLISQLVVSTE